MPATMLDLVVRRARVHGGPADLVDIAIAAGRIVALNSSLPSGGREIDAAGALVVPGFVDTHLHLDKSRTIDRCHVVEGSLGEAIRETARIKADFTEEDIYERARLTLEDCIVQGTTSVRTHVEVDATVELRGFRAISQLARDYSDVVDLQICVFAQEGLTDSPRGEELLRESLELGAEVIGGAPYSDPDPTGQLDRVFDLARRFDVDIDLHLDLAESPSGMLLEDVCRRTVAQGWEGRVAVGHVTQLSLLEPDRYERLCRVVAESGVAVTVLPSTDLFLMGRAAVAAKPRGVVPLGPLYERGVCCSIATNNVLNAFTPYGDGSLLRAANLYANVTYAADPRDLEACLDFITSSAARLMSIEAYGVAENMTADLVCLDAASGSDAVARVAVPLWGLKGGRQTFRRERPMVLRG